MSTQVRNYRIAALVTLISIVTIIAVVALGQRDSTAGTPSGSPFSGQGSEVPGSPFEGSGSPVGGESFSDSGSPVGTIQTMGWKPARGETVLTGTTADGGESFTAQASPATSAEIAAIQRSGGGGCSGTYWTWRGHFESVRSGVLFYKFGPINYWCGTKRGHVAKDGWGWVNKLGAYGGVYAFKGGSRSHTPFGWPSVHVIDKWHYYRAEIHDDRYPMVDYDLFANGSVSGTVYKG